MPYSLHFTIGAMAHCRGVMNEFEMRVHAEYIPWDDARFSAATTEASEELAGAQRVVGGVGIPSFKLDSNGPWLVHPDEIDGALTVYRAASAEARRDAEREADVWRLWLEWVEETRDHGGFHVT